jgi:malonate-semialdehyde dehydrogenase (acetylating)/methylmalonate-semialdehyde dehydrogenase
MEKVNVGSDVPVVGHWIAGALRMGTGERTGDVYNPATGDVTKKVAFAAASDVNDAVAAAEAAFATWRTSTLAQRVRILFAFRQLCIDRQDELAAIITSEHGKTLDDAAGEIARGLEVVEFACGIPHLLKGGFSEGVSSNVDVYSLRQPLGPVAIISPFNFPAMVPCWFFPVAIAAGNTVVLKPSERDPSAANWFAERWAEAGLPAGVFNVLHGDKTAVTGLIEHPAIKAVSFVGSTPVAHSVYELGTKAGKRVQALGGAKNHMIVLADADLNQAANAAVSAGFGSAGERCMAISVVVVVDDVADALVAKIVETMATLRVGDGRRSCDMGPLVTKEHLARVAGYVERGVSEGADLVVDGRGIAVDGASGGFWLGPTLFDRVTPEMTIYTDEIFGPVLSIIRVHSFDAAMNLVNANAHGNGAAIFTGDGYAARRFQSEIEVGMVGINVPIPVPVSYYSFGGWKNSLFGDTHAHGTEGVHFFTRGKVVTSRWPESSHQGLDFAFPQNA